MRVFCEFIPDVIPIWTLTLDPVGNGLQCNAEKVESYHVCVVLVQYVVLKLYCGCLLASILALNHIVLATISLICILSFKKERKRNKKGYHAQI